MNTKKELKDMTPDEYREETAQAMVQISSEYPSKRDGTWTIEQAREQVREDLSDQWVRNFQSSNCLPRTWASEYLALM
ncbi:MAG: hypothetical protein LBG30_02420 [Odoribacteraceae bacterium]|nr:hypothetical protein [Odoribacteraceae bacterium]